LRYIEEGNVYQVLARKWRPKKFEEVIGQSHITNTLVNAIKSEKIAHAYLFTGTRGVGKTTIARLFAKAIRCENLTDNNPCNECNSCVAINNSNSLDYIEIDGASNNGVDNIRELIENVQYLPSSGKYKVYVIDEVHMLSTGAFNALLKTLEEPPAHVVFVFATTDPHKLLGTVLSRCQRFDFKSVSKELLTSHLKNIAAKENIEFESDGLIEIIADHGDGSVRDSLSLLDQVLSLSLGEKIKEEELYASLGLINKSLILNLVEAILNKEQEDFTNAMLKIKAENISYEKFLDQFLNVLYDFINNIDNTEVLNERYKINVNFSFITTAEMMWIYESIIKDSTWALNSFDPAKSIEFVLLKTVKREEILGLESDSKKKVKINSKISMEQVEEEPAQAIMPVAPAVETTSENIVESTDETIPEEVVEPIAEPEVVNSPIQRENTWDDFINFCREESKSISVNLERALFDKAFNPENLEVIFSDDSRIFADFIKEPENLNRLKQIVSNYANLSSDKVNVRVITIDDNKKKEDNLLSKVEKEQLKEQQDKEDLEARLRDNKFIKEAQELFNTKISKVILNQREEE
tara:strand:- start:152216 stop:153958 length:1743 start_codon:yes stop_codon:yes gene_type:complete